VAFTSKGLVPAGAPEATVLVIDDDPAARDLMARGLSKENFKVVTAPSGEDGIRIAREIKPDIITLDILMPGMDGWAVLRALKSDLALCDIPVIMISMMDDKEMGHTLGAADFLPKPIDRDRLLATLRRYRRPGVGNAVLVVEDDKDIRDMMRRALEMDGWKVAEAENGRVALTRVEASRPDLILLDLMMPEMDGFEFVEALRRKDAWSGIPVVVVTAKDLSATDRARLDGHVGLDETRRPGARDPKPVAASRHGRASVVNGGGRSWLYSAVVVVRISTAS
jgi:DNA-binding response OmpR family regulator